jgi:hypothetical protein
MKKRTLLTIGILMGLSVSLSAQSGATEGNSASANLLVAMTLQEQSTLSFGSTLITDTAVEGKVVLASTNATRVHTGGVEGSAATPTASNATYAVTGTALETYAVSLPASIEVVHGTNTDQKMTINAMTARFNNANEDAVTSTLSATGTDSFSVGGTLTVAPGQLGGAYAGTFEVTVDYN